MSLQFLIGPGGCGKTTQLHKYLMKKTKECPDTNIFVIVPEQFTMETQSALATLHPGHSVFQIDIVSFQRLAYRIFEELSCAPKTVLDDTGKSMLIRKSCGVVEKDLEIYKGHLDRPGFIEELKSIMSEFGQYRIGQDKLANAGQEESLSPLLAKKLKDLSLLSEAYYGAMDPDTIPAEELLDRLAKVIPDSELLKGSIVALDGFTGFTPAQLDVLEVLLRFCGEVLITVTADETLDPMDASNQKDIFALSRKMIGELSKRAQSAGAAINESWLIAPHDNDRFAASKELRFMEQNLLRFNKKTWDGKPQDIRLIAAENALEECRFLTDEIQKLVREQGLRYKEIAIVCGNIETYTPLLEQTMSEAQIPVFMDDKRNLLSNPVVESMRAVLDVIENDFSYDTIFRYLKSGFGNIEPNLLFDMENYVLARGIRGHKKWEEVWEKLYRGGDHLNMEKLNEARVQAITPILTLREVLKKKDATVREMTEGLFCWLESRDADEILTAMADKFQEEGEYSLAAEYYQAYDQLLGLFDRIVGLLGEEVMPLTNYRDILEAGCQEIRVGVIPAAIDRVLVGDVQRSRLVGIRALFFIGVNDGAVPSAGKVGGLLSELDRENLKGYMDLSPTRRESSLIDKFYYYLTLTKPSEKLYISYATADEKGEGKSPSSYLTYLKRLFPALKEEYPVAAERTPYTLPMALKVLSEGFEEYKQRKQPESWDELYRYLWTEPAAEALLERMESAALESYKGDAISKAVASVLYGEPISGSVSRLENYAACAYAQFLNYGLNLMKRQEFEFAAMDMGNVFHKAIELVFNKAIAEDFSIGNLTEDERKALCHEAMEAAASELGAALLSTHRNEHLFKRMEEIADRTLWALGEQLKAGDFTPKHIELKFRAGENDAMYLDLGEGSTMQLKGKIDRVDEYDDGENIYVKIIDYKTGDKDIDLNQIYYGLQIQLVVYMNAVMEHEKKLHPGKNIIPAGLFYSTFQDPMLKREEAEGCEEDVFRAALCPKGFVTSDENALYHLERNAGDGKSDVIPVSRKDGRVKPNKNVISAAQFEHMKNFVTKRMTEFGEAMAEGSVSALPYMMGSKSGCDFCDFKAVCGFDKKKNGYHFRRLPALDPDDIWETMAEEDQEREEEV